MKNLFGVVSNDWFFIDFHLFFFVLGLSETGPDVVGIGIWFDWVSMDWTTGRFVSLFFCWDRIFEDVDQFLILVHRICFVFFSDWLWKVKRAIGDADWLSAYPMGSSRSADSIVAPQLGHGAHFKLAKCYFDKVISLEFKKKCRYRSIRTSPAPFPKKMPKKIDKNAKQLSDRFFIWKRKKTVDSLQVFQVRIKETKFK